MYLLRLDDASEYMDVEKWVKLETILDKYNIKPIFGVIPRNRDEDFAKRYTKNSSFWELAKKWKDKGWAPALHGYEHVFCSTQGGINPVNKKSEFAGVSLNEQREKVERGYSIMMEKGLEPKIFFAPAHTFDENTLIALRDKTGIRVISDTIANDVYFYNGFFFVPQQAGYVRKLPFKIATFCYHPNNMQIKDYERLENFLEKYSREFISFNDLKLKQKKRSLYDNLLKNAYFAKRRFV